MISILGMGDPRQNAAASLKQVGDEILGVVEGGDPRQNAAASLKPEDLLHLDHGRDEVIRGRTPRPH